MMTKAEVIEAIINRSGARGYDDNFWYTLSMKLMGYMTKADLIDMAWRECNLDLEGEE